MQSNYTASGYDTDICYGDLTLVFTHLMSNNLR